MDFQLNLSSETIQHGCIAEPVCVEPQTPIRDVMLALKARNTGAALICDADGVLIGIFTERDALRLLAAKASLAAPIEKVMTPEPKTLSSDDVVGDAIARMAQGGYRRLPVVDDNGKAIGVVKTSVVLHYLVAHFPSVVYNLPPDPHHITRQREGA